MKKIALSVAALFTATGLSAQMLYELGPDLEAVSVDLDLFASDPNWVGFPTAEEGAVIYVQSAFEDTDEGYVWQGRIPGHDMNSALIIGDEQGFYGTFGDYGSQRYAISANNGLFTVRALATESREDRRAECQVLSPPKMAGQISASSSDSHTGDLETDPVSVMSASTYKPTIDLLVLYTQGAIDNVTDSGFNTVDEMVNYPVHWINTEVYPNNNINGRLRVVHHQKVPDGVDKMDVWVRGLLNSEVVNALRYKHRADIVLLYEHDEYSACGYAWSKIHGSVEKRMAYAAQAQVNLTCGYMRPYYSSVAHELGHTFGAQHDRGNSGDWERKNRVMPYAHGHVDHGSKKYTILAYRWGCGGRIFGSACSVVPYYSTTRVSPNGWTLGVKNQSENERVISDRFSITAGFSNLIDPTLVPAVPTGFDVKVVRVSGKYHARLYWTENAENEARYEVKWGRKGSRKQVLRFPYDEYPNLNTWEIRDLTSGKEYTFRVFAKNRFGETKTERIERTIP